MKKFFSLVTVFIMAISLAGVLPAINVSAETYGDYEYTVLYDGTVEITGYTGSETDIEIPDEIDGKAVTRIEYYAFANCSLTSVTIPNSVTNIGYRAFEYCESLTEINVDSNNKNYSSQDGVLFNYNKTELIQYPIGKTQTSYTIPRSVTIIEDWAFQLCTSLTSITIPNSVTSIGKYAFKDTLWLTKKQKENPLVIINGILIDGSTCVGDITIPEGVTSIGSMSFSYCENLTRIILPNSLINICDDAFSHCEILISVTIGSNLVSIGKSVFSDCKNLIEITIPKSVKNIGTRAFENCYKLTIKCFKDSYAEQYALKNDIEYKLLSEVVLTNKSINQINKRQSNSKPAKVKSVKLAAKKKKLNVKWKKISGATGYEVVYATNNKFTKNEKTVTVKKNKVTLKRLKSKKKYFVKVRAYKTVNGSTYYGKWSKVVKKKVK